MRRVGVAVLAKVCHVVDIYRIVCPSDQLEQSIFDRYVWWKRFRSEYIFLENVCLLVHDSYQGTIQLLSIYSVQHEWLRPSLLLKFALVASTKLVF